jgi:hypothetical protein
MKTGWGRTMVKRLIVTVVLAVLSSAAAAQTYKLTWALTDFSAGGVNFPWLELDIMQTGRYLAAHGAVLTETRQLSPVTGTCVAVGNGYFCNLQVDRNSYFLTVDSQLNGKVTGRDGAGNLLPEATAKLYSKQ